MKTLLNYLLFLLIVLTPMALTSCGDDDDNSTPAQEQPGGNQNQQPNDSIPEQKPDSIPDDEPEVDPEPITEVVTPPDGLNTETYNVKFTDPRNNETYTKQVKLGFYQDSVLNVYIQGLSDLLPNSWVKGRLSRKNVLTIPQTFLGDYIIPYSDPYPMTFTLTRFNYNPSTSTFTSSEGFRTTSGQQTIDFFTDIVMKKVVERAATPANPTCKFQRSSFGTMFLLEMNVPIIDTNSEPILSDKLSYVIFYEKDGQVSPITFTPELYTRLTEPMTEIPYNFTDRYDIDNYEIYMNQGEDELRTWTRVGIQSIYRGGGEEHMSEIGWFDMVSYWQTDTK